MAFYRYEAVDKAGKTVMGTMDAPTESEVTLRLSQMGYQPQAIMPAPGQRVRTSSLRPARPGTAVVGGGAAGTAPPASRAMARPKDLALFFRQFASLVRSGIHLFQSLDNLAPRTKHPALREAATAMADSARNGQPISEVMTRYPGLFAPHVVASVRAGELGGFLEIVLDEIALGYEEEIAFYRGFWLIRSFGIQGVFVIAVAQPFFQKLFATDKPNLTDYNWSQQMYEYAMLVVFRNLPIAAVIVLAYYLWLRWWLKPENRPRRDRTVLRLPVFGDLARQHSLFAFVRMLHRLFAAGLQPIQAWEGAMSVPPNSEVRARLLEAHELVAKGMPLHEAFIQTGLFTDETVQLLATGVMTGQMVEMLDRSAEFYHDNVDRAVRASRFWMWRLGCSFALILGGAALILLTYTYVQALFNNPFVKPE